MGPLCRARLRWRTLASATFLSDRREDVCTVLPDCGTACAAFLSDRKRERRSLAAADARCSALPSLALFRLSCQTAFTESPPTGGRSSGRGRRVGGWHRA